MIATADLTPGELVVVSNPDGRWLGGYEYVRPDHRDPDRVVVRERSRRGQLFTVQTCYVSRPCVGACVEHDPADTEPASGGSVAPPAGELTITAAQRRRLFAMGRSLGVDIDDLRAMTPAGSISMLTRRQASNLIDRLAGHRGRSGFRDQGTATAKQLGMIAHLRDEIGFADAEFSAWLAKRFKVTGIDDISDRAHASRVIGGLMKMAENLAAGGSARRRRPTPERSGARAGA